MQCGDRLAGARAALHDEDALQPSADDAVLLGLDGRHDIGHAAGARAADSGDESGLAGERRPVTFGQFVEVEDLVVHTRDLAPPGVDVAPPDHAERIFRRRGIERAGRGGPPVDQLELVVVVTQADPADVQRGLTLVVGTAEAQAPLDPVQLGQPALVLGGGNISFEPRLMRAAGAALRPDLAQRLLAALARLVEQPVQHRDVCLLSLDRGLLGRRAALRVIRAPGLGFRLTKNHVR